MGKLTEEQVVEFVAAADLSFTKIDKASSLKTNNLIGDKNFTLLQGYLTKLKGYVEYIQDLIDIQQIIDQIIAQQQSSKSVLLISTTMNIGDNSTQKVNGVNYKVTRTDDYIIEISNLNNTEWVTDFLMVQVKNNNGAIVYPLIFTVNNKIIVHFIDGITSDYKLFFI